MKKVIIERRLPGSGKSHHARMVFAAQSAAGKKVVICSADDYFEERAAKQGKTYLEVFNPMLLAEAHSACMFKFLDALNRGIEVVIVDNTNSQRWEYQNYEAAAKLAGYEVEVRSAMPPNSGDASLYMLRTFASRNTHGVPAAKIAEMAMRWED